MLYVLGMFVFTNATACVCQVSSLLPEDSRSHRAWSLGCKHLVTRAGVPKASYVSESLATVSQVLGVQVRVSRPKFYAELGMDPPSLGHEHVSVLPAQL